MRSLSDQAPPAQAVQEPEEAREDRQPRLRRFRLRRLRPPENRACFPDRGAEDCEEDDYGEDEEGQGSEVNPGQPIMAFWKPLLAGVNKNPLCIINNDSIVISTPSNNDHHLNNVNEQ